MGQGKRRPFPTNHPSIQASNVTQALREAMRSWSKSVPLSNDGRIMIFAGGIPLTHDGKVVGAIGVSGGSSEQDQTVAEAGVEATAGAGENS